MKKILLSLIFLILFSVQAHALICGTGGGCFEVASGCSGNWNSSTCWANTSGGTTGVGPPASTDAVTFDSNSGNITVNATAFAASLSMTAGTGNYTGTITWSSNIRLQVGGSITLSSGTTLVGNGTGGFYLNGSSSTITSAGVTIPVLQVWIATMALTLGDNVTVSGVCSNTFSSTISNITVTGAHNLSCTTFNYATSTSGTTFIFPASQTLTITTAANISGTTSAPITMKSGTTSTAFNLNYTGTTGNANFSNIVFTDVNASGSTQAVSNWFGGTLTRTTNITNVTAANLSASAGSNGYAY